MKQFRGYKILDNGAAERGNPIPWNDLITIGDHWYCHEIVLPDFPFDRKATIEAVMQVKASCKARRSAGNPTKYQAVVQGQDLSDWMACVNYYVGEDWIDVIAFPRNMNLAHKTQRLNFIQAWLDSMSALFPRPIEVHCLGAEGWVREVVALAEIEAIRSMDTSMPCHFAMQNRRIQENEYTKRPPNYFEWEPDDYQRTLAINNANVFYEWAGDPTSRCELF